MFRVVCRHVRCNATLYHNTPSYTVSYHTVLSYILHYTILYHTTLYYVIYHTIPYHTILCFAKLFYYIVESNLMNQLSQNNISCYGSIYISLSHRRDLSKPLSSLVNRMVLPHKHKVVGKGWLAFIGKHVRREWIILQWKSGMRGEEKKKEEFDADGNQLILYRF